MDWIAEETYCRPGRLFQIPDGGGALLEHFAGRFARVQEIMRTRGRPVVRFEVAGVSIACPLAYLANALRQNAEPMRKAA